MLSNRAKYATRAILELTFRYGEDPIQAQDIATRQRIPLKFLEQILLTLRRHGLVQSRKGPGGGYTLARPPHEVSLAEVVRSIDGSLAPVPCVEGVSCEDCGCPYPDGCGLQQTWQEAHLALSAVLEGTSFAEIRDRHERLTAHSREVPNYVI
ncbi:MAG TPA: Rrf2 family transcriptional regulator [Armatimonadota bacterium]|jgi:Rrf2 family protein